MNKLEVYKKYFETAKDDSHLVMHRGYALALVKMVEELTKTLESSMGNTKAWVDKFNKLEKKYDQALTVISSKKIIEMQEENELMRDVIQDAVSTGEALGWNFFIEPWNSLKDVADKFTKAK